MNKIKPEIKDDIAETLFIPLLSRSRKSPERRDIKKTRWHVSLLRK